MRLATSLLGAVPVCLVLLACSALGVLAQQSPCSTPFSVNGIQKNFSLCLPLTLTPGISIAWTQTGSTLEVGFTGTVYAATSSWVAWGINPSSSGGDFMPGGCAIFAQIGSDGSVTLVVYNLYDSGLLASNGTYFLSVNDKAAEIDGSLVKIWVTLQWSSPTVFHSWNSGASDPNGVLLQHPDSQLTTKQLLNLISGNAAQSTSIANQRLKYNHGIFAVVSWGILIPLGIMVARYVRQFEGFNPAWFYAHICFQSLGFVLGAVSWVMGIKLGNDSPGVTYDSHRTLGFAVFVGSILQVLALLLRPKLENKTVRPFWNVYHHSIGYLAAALAIVNIFIGFHILADQGAPKNNYKIAFIAVLAAFGGIAFFLEVFTWTKYLASKGKRAHVPETPRVVQI